MSAGHVPSASKAGIHNISLFYFGKGRNMNNELVCIEQKNFGSLSCDIYQNTDKNIYITGTAIGAALE